MRYGQNYFEWEDDGFMITNNVKPLVSFLLFSYNQERFIKEAVEGALSQTYSPLEIIFSDDCSTDKTFEIMQNIVAHYTGPHKIILNRNENNLGIGGHVNRCMQLSHGELIVIAAGDDISLPERTSEIYKAWIDSGKTAFSFESSRVDINESGDIINRPSLTFLPQEHQLRHFSKTLQSYVLGACHAWHRKVFDVFGPLPNITMEDVAIPPRAMLLGRVVRIDKVLVKYRVHESNIYISNRKRTAKESIERSIYYINDRITICADIVRCVNEYKRTIKDSLRLNELDEYIANINHNKEKLALKVKILSSYPVIRFCLLLKYIILYGLQSKDLSIFAYAISFTVYRLSREIYNRLSKHKI